MKEAIGGTWLFQIVIVFIFIFTGYICLSINHSKAFAVKDDLIETIERYNGIDLNAVYSDSKKLSNDPCINEMTERLKTVSYRTSGDCTKLKKAKNGGEWVGFDRQGKMNSKNATYCIEEIIASKDSGKIDSTLPIIKYYKIAVFYQLDLPVLNTFLSFKEVGDTKLLYGSGK